MEQMNQSEHEVLCREFAAGFLDARATRAQGNEGRARVQARILAGRAVEYYAIRHSGEMPQRNAWEWLVWLSEQEQFPLEVSRCASRLTVRVTPQFTLPHPEDPLEDAERIVDFFMECMKT